MELKKNIGKFEVTSLAIGSIIGSGAFILPGDFFLKEIGLYNTIIGLILGAISIIIIEKNYGFLINKFPQAGGEYIFVKNSLGLKHAFFCGWFLILAYVLIVPLNATALSVGINTIFPDLLKIGYLYTVAGYKVYLGELIPPILTLFIFAYLNIKNAKKATLTQNLMVLFLVGTILLFTSLFLLNYGVDSKNIIQHLDINSVSLEKILRIAIIAPFLFIGFDCIPQVAEELNFEANKASLLAIFSIITGAVLYICLTFITAYGFSAKELQNSVNWATGESIYFHFGLAGLICISLAFFTAIIAGINGFYMASSRLILAMAREGDLSSKLKEVDKTYKTPKAALICILIISLIAPFLGRRVLLWIVDMSSIGGIIAYFYTCISSTILYKKDFGKLNLWGIFGVIISCSFILLMLLPKLPTSLGKESYIALILWTFLGFAFFTKKVKIDTSTQRRYNQID